MIIDYSQLGKIRAENRDKEIIFFDGTFDLLSVGHTDTLRKLKELGDILVVGVMSDQWVKEKKGETRPIRFGEERLWMIDAIRWVDYAFLLEDKKDKRRIKTSEAVLSLKPDIFVSTDEVWAKKSNWFKEIGVKLKVVERVPPLIKTSVKPISTTGTIERILNLFGQR